MLLVRFVIDDDGDATVLDVPLNTERRDLVVREAVRPVDQILADVVNGEAYPGHLSVTVELPEEQTIVVAASVTFNMKWPDAPLDSSAKAGEHGERQDKHKAGSGKDDCCRYGGHDGAS